MSPTLDSRKEQMKMCQAKIEKALRLLVGAVVLTVPIACGTKAPPGPSALVLPTAAYHAEVTPQDPPTTGTAGSMATMTVNVKNLSETTWPANREGFAIGLSYHWKDTAGNVIVFDGLRTPINVSLTPGMSVPLQASIQFPPKPGDYVLELDLVQEWVTWFVDKGSNTAKLKVRVE